MAGHEDAGDTVALALRPRRLVLVLASTLGFSAVCIAAAASDRGSDTLRVIQIVFAVVLLIASISPAWKLLRGAPPIVLDAAGIDVFSTGAIPWTAIDMVTFGYRPNGSATMTVHLVDLQAARGAPWFTRWHRWMALTNRGGDLTVPLGTTAATSHEVATHIRRFSGVQVIG